ncbi:DNA-damage-inducible protein P%2C putative [Mycobacterium tuberculosis]|nr:DNA-damage-inducible protein P%2C putative [Mycobacterium tuberculosis]
MLHLDMDAFFASVEQLTRPTLRGRPVLVGGLGGRGVVAGASYEARAYGARSAMPMHQARRLIGVTAVVLPPRGVVYGIASRRVFDTVRGLVPVVEQLSFDEAFAEPPQLAGAVAEDVETFCERLRRRVRDETGLIASVGAGSGKQIAKIASGLAKPDGIRVVRHAEEQALLSGLPVRRLWGIGPVAEEKLHRLGIETIGQLAALSDAEAANILGATIGPALHRLARGIDDRPVVERAEAKQISAESTFAVDLTTMEQLHEAIDSIAEHAHQRLLRDGRGARTITVKLKKSDMSTLTRSATMPYPTTDAGALFTVARRLLPDPLQIGPIRLLGVGFSGLSDIRQESLFADSDLTQETAAAHYVETPGAVVPAAHDATMWRAAMTSPTLSLGTAGCRERATAWSPCGSKRVVQARARRGRSPSTPATSATPARLTAWTGRTTSASYRSRGPPAPQPQRSMTSATGELAASAAISSTRAWDGGSRGTITAPASTRSCPGP